MKQHQTRLRKTLNNKAPDPTHIWNEPRSSVYLFLKIWGAFFETRIYKENKNLKKTYKHTHRSVITLLNTLSFVYIVLIKQRNLKSLWFLSKKLVKKTHGFLKNTGFLKNNTNYIIIPKTSLKHQPV